MEQRKNKVRDLVRRSAPQQTTPSEPTTPTPVASEETMVQTTQEVVSEYHLDLTPDLVEKLDALRNTNRGRRANRVPQERHPRATFIIPTILTRKLKYVALMETKLYSKVVQEALERYITDYESRHGEIVIK